jgi:two-component system cell cycle response regulator DivK
MAMALRKIKKIKRLEPQAPKTTVLYVEDAAVIRDTIARLLELKGEYKVLYAHNGQEGVEKAIKAQPDIILMDLRMPVMDGHQAIREIRANPKTHHIPVFVVSAWSSKKDRMAAGAAGANEYFVKPPDIDQLIEAINAAVGHSPL